MLSQEDLKELRELADASIGGSDPAWNTPRQVQLWKKWGGTRIVPELLNHIDGLYNYIKASGRLVPKDNELSVD